MSRILFENCNNLFIVIFTLFGLACFTTVLVYGLGLIVSNYRYNKNQRVEFLKETKNQLDNLHRNRELEFLAMHERINELDKVIADLKKKQL